MARSERKRVPFKVYHPLAVIGKGETDADFIMHLGALGEGMDVRVYDAVISPAAIETAVVTLPAGSVVDAVWMNVDSALTGGSTTVTASLGINGDVDNLGTMASNDYTTQGDLLAQNSKWTAHLGTEPLVGAGDAIGVFNEAAVAVVLAGAVAGGATAGDTALTVGSVRIRIQYRVALTLPDLA